MSGPVPSPSMKGMVGRSGTVKRSSAACQRISWPSAGGVESLNVLAKAMLLLKGDGKRGAPRRLRPQEPGRAGYGITEGRATFRTMDWEPLVTAATAARAHAYAPYS